MCACLLGKDKVQIASPEVFIDTYCLSKDKTGNVHICFFQKAPNKDVCVTRALLPEPVAEKMARSLLDMLKKTANIKEKDSDEMRYIA